MDLISRDKAQDTIFSKEDILGYMDSAEDGDINRTIRSAIRLIEMIPSAFEGMTNGEVLKSIFPTAELMLGNSDYIPDVLCVKEEWWNAPYQKGGE